MTQVWLPLTGKECYVNGWQGIEYKGVDCVTHDGDLGLRLDNYIVIDCDSTEARDAWLAHIGTQGIHHTWVRKSPKGWHFFYKRTVDAYGVKSGKYPDVHPLIDVKAGMGHYVGFRGEGRYDVSGSSKVDLCAFDPAWLPERSQAEWQGLEWSEMPDGIGDNSMIGFAGTFRRWGMDEETILRCLAAVNQLTMTENPMPPKRLRRLARQAAKWNPEEPKTVLCPKCETEIETR